MLSGRPLLANAPDAALLMERPGEMSALKSAVRADFNTLLSGPAGSGRTTTLHALASKLTRASRKGNRRTVAYVRVEAAATPAVLLDAVSGAITGAPVPVSASTDAALDALARAVANSAGPLLMMVDDVPGIVGHAVFGLARDALWELPARWMVAARTAQVPTLLSPPADAFFEAHIQMTPLSAQQACELVARRAPELELDWVPAVLEASTGTPRAVLDGARALLAGAGGDAVADTARARTAALAALGRPAQTMAAALEALGAASASDEQLLGMLGISRARAVQVLGPMESAGVVAAESVSTGRGHPRKVYRLRPL